MCSPHFCHPVAWTPSARPPPPAAFSCGLTFVSHHHMLAHTVPFLGFSPPTLALSSVTQPKTHVDSLPSPVVILQAPPFCRKPILHSLPTYCWNAFAHLPVVTCWSDQATHPLSLSSADFWGQGCCCHGYEVVSVEAFGASRWLTEDISASEPVFLTQILLFQHECLSGDHKSSWRGAGSSSAVPLVQCLVRRQAHSRYSKRTHPELLSSCYPYNQVLTGDADRRCSPEKDSTHDFLLEKGHQQYDHLVRCEHNCELPKDWATRL